MFHVCFGDCRGFSSRFGFAVMPTYKGQRCSSIQSLLCHGHGSFGSDALVGQVSHLDGNPGPFLVLVEKHCQPVGVVSLSIGCLVQISGPQWLPLGLRHLDQGQVGSKAKQRSPKASVGGSLLASYNVGNHKAFGNAKSGDLCLLKMLGTIRPLGSFKASTGQE